MASSYQGNFIFNAFGISLNAPSELGVYYCGNLNADGSLNPLYIGRARGDETTIRTRLQAHFNNGGWIGATHFGFKVCNSAYEATLLEQQEIQNFQPRYNTQGVQHGADLFAALFKKP